MSAGTCPYCKTLVGDAGAALCRSCGRALDDRAGGVPADATMIVNRPRQAPPPAATRAASTPPTAPSADKPAPGARPASLDDLPAEATVIVNVPKPTRDLPAPPASAGSTARAAAGGTTQTMPPPDTGIEAGAPVAGWTQVAYLEAALMQRPLPQARTLRTLHRNEPVGVVRYHGGFAAVRLPDGATGYVVRAALGSSPAAPEMSSPEDAFAARPNVVRVRADGAAFRDRPSRLASAIRPLQMGEPVQLRSFTAFFAQVETVDGATGYVERSALSQASVAGSTRMPVGPIAFGATALLAFIGAILPWTSACAGCASKTGLDHAEGILVLLIALASSGLIVAFHRMPNVPREHLLWGMSAAGGAVALLALVARSGDSYAFESGVHVTLIAGIAMAVAPWIDRLQASIATNGMGQRRDDDA